MNTLKPSDLLRQAKHELAKRIWIQEKAAKNQAGDIICDNMKNATSICCLGGFWAACEILQCLYFGELIETAQEYFIKANNTISIPYWNDKVCNSKQQALMAFDKAINLAKESERSEL